MQGLWERSSLTCTHIPDTSHQNQRKQMRSQGNTIALPLLSHAVPAPSFTCECPPAGRRLLPAMKILHLSRPNASLAFDRTSLSWQSGQLISTWWDDSLNTSSTTNLNNAWTACDNIIGYQLAVGNCKTCCQLSNTELRTAMVWKNGFDPEPPASTAKSPSWFTTCTGAALAWFGIVWDLACKDLQYSNPLPLAQVARDFFTPGPQVRWWLSYRVHPCPNS